MSPPDPRRVLVESVPIAGIMLFWFVVALVGWHPLVGTGARIAGIVMALTYAVVRGVAFARRSRRSPRLDDGATVLRVNGLALVAAAGWFVLARVVLFSEPLVSPWLVHLPVGSVVDGLAFAFTATGVVTVVLYAVAVGTAAIHGTSPPRGRTASDVSPADD